MLWRSQIADEGREMNNDKCLAAERRDNSGGPGLRTWETDGPFDLDKNYEESWDDKKANKRRVWNGRRNVNCHRRTRREKANCMNGGWLPKATIDHPR